MPTLAVFQLYLVYTWWLMPTLAVFQLYLVYTWCLMPTLAVFQLYLGVHMVFNANFSSISTISWCTQTICRRHVRHRSVSTLVLLLKKMITLKTAFRIYYVLIGWFSRTSRKLIFQGLMAVGPDQPTMEIILHQMGFFHWKVVCWYKRNVSTFFLVLKPQ